MLEVRRIAAVRRYRRPIIGEYLHARAATIHHRLNRENHSFLQPLTLSRGAVVRNLRLFVHPGSDAVPDELANNRKAVLFDPLLHSGRYITEPIPRPDILNGALERFARHSQELLPLRRNLAHRNRERRIAEVTVQLDAEIHRENVAFLQLAAGRRDAVRSEE